MKREICVFTLIILSCAMLVNAEPISITLKSPSNGAVITGFSLDFIFDFNQQPDNINECSLIIDNAVKGTRNSMIIMSNNKINAQVESGNHIWLIKCYDTSSKEINSETRSFSIKAPALSNESYEIFYNNNGLRSYIITIAQGQKPVTLPAMKGGEGIEIKISGKTYYLDIIKMGVNINTTFVDVRDRTSGKTYKMLTPTTLSFDLNNDKTTDISLTLKNVERTVNAYFVVTPYPAAGEAPEETMPAETPTGQPAEKPTIPAEQPEQELAAQPEQGITKEEDDQMKASEKTLEQQEEGKSKTLLIAMGIILGLIIILLIVYAIMKMKKSGKKQKQAGQKNVKKEVKKEKEAYAENDEPLPASNEKFDIIKSTGRRK
jgi:competence protein ComGC